MEPSTSGTPPKIKIVKRDGYWYLEFTDFSIRSPYAETAPRDDVVGYVKRSFPDAFIIGDKNNAAESG